MSTGREKPFGEIVREAAELVWPWLKKRGAISYKVKSRKLKGGRTKLTIDVGVPPP